MVQSPKEIRDQNHIFICGNCLGKTYIYGHEYFLETVLLVTLSSQDGCVVFYRSCVMPEHELNCCVHNENEIKSELLKNDKKFII